MTDSKEDSDEGDAFAEVGKSCALDVMKVYPLLFILLFLRPLVNSVGGRDKTQYLKIGNAVKWLFS